MLIPIQEVTAFPGFSEIEDSGCKRCGLMSWACKCPEVLEPHCEQRRAEDLGFDPYKD